MMIYASRTGTRRNIAAMADAGWGWIVGPLDMGGPIRAGMPHALDNGAWPAHINDEPWNEPAFLVALDRYGPTADFIVVPDIVAGGAGSLALTLEWLPRLLAREDLASAKLLIAVQDGMESDDVRHLLNERVGIFVGGTTDWKEGTLRQWGALKRETGCYLHVGRVNTARRIHLCLAVDADSCDGTSGTRFAKTIAPLNLARKQMDLEMLCA